MRPQTPNVESWHPTLSHQASEEGWDIFECSGSSDGFWQLQMCDDMKMFEDDAAAWQHVWRYAMGESPLHAYAIMFLRTHNQQEYDAIRNFCRENP